eukprot:scaffold102337_cov37-Cyclotella_meneghiniana.AAC.2
MFFDGEASRAGNVPRVDNMKNDIAAIRHLAVVDANARGLNLVGVATVGSDADAAVRRSRVDRCRWRCA